ncbi:MAG: hypothetical protein ACJ754_19350 [Pyrinomonadaceae bacterium]
MGEETQNEIQDYEPPVWLTRSLGLLRNSALLGEYPPPASAPPSEGFERRCLEAGRAAFDLRKMRLERQRIGFVPLSFAAYVEGLSKLAGVRLPALLAWLGAEDLPAARASARLARALGVSLREALAHARISLAEGVDGAPMPLLLARHRAPGRRDKVEQCEEVLALVEAEYDGARLRELRETEAVFRAAYAESEEEAV